MADLKEWAVDLIVTTEHNYVVLARTAEEAVGQAEDLLDSGDDGEIVATSLDSADAVSANEAADAYAVDEFDEEVVLDIEP